MSKQEISQLWASNDKDDNLNAIKMLIDTNEAEMIALAASWYYSLFQRYGEHDFYELSIDTLKKAAQINHIPSLLNLAKITNDLDDWRQAADQDIQEAVVYMAHFYQLQSQTTNVYDSCAEYSKKATLVGDVASIHWVTENAMDSDFDLEAVLDILCRSADNDNYHACLLAGQMLYSRDVNRSIHYFTKAAQQAQTPTFASLGMHLVNGDSEAGLAPNQEQGIEILELGEKSGCCQSIKLLGDLYSKLNRKDAHEYYERAFEKGYMDALPGLTRYYIETKNFQKAQECIELFTKSKLTREEIEALRIN